MRDYFNDSFTGIHVNQKSMYSEVKEYLKEIAPKKQSIVKLHKSHNPIFEEYGIERQIKTAFGRTVTMSKGAYLIIEHTEALHVIDVNSGNRSTKSKNQEDSALEVNLIAASEIARQLRLRDMGGITVIDFIDMRNPANKKKVFEEMHNYMRPDRAKHTILPLTKFNLMQITRQRVRPETAVDTSEVCPTCDGKGKINSSILIVDDIERELNFLFNDKNKDKHKSLKVFCHPYVAAYVTQGWWFSSILSKWKRKYKKSIKIIANNNFHLSQLKFVDADGEIKL